MIYLKGILGFLFLIISYCAQAKESISIVEISFSCDEYDTTHHAEFGSFSLVCKGKQYLGKSSGEEIVFKYGSNTVGDFIEPLFVNQYAKLTMVYFRCISINGDVVSVINEKDNEIVTIDLANQCSTFIELKLNKFFKKHNVTVSPFHQSELGENCYEIVRYRRGNIWLNSNSERCDSTKAISLEVTDCLVNIDFENSLPFKIVDMSLW